MDGDQVRSTGRRGRPPEQGESAVPDLLLDAFGRCLREKSYAEITIKEVAEQAGVSHEMIRYYFGGRNGLIVAALQQSAARFRERLDELAAHAASGAPDALARLVRTLFAMYRDARSLALISIAESGKAASPIRQLYLGEKSGLIVSSVHDILCKLGPAHGFTADADYRKAAVLTVSTLSGFTSLTRALPNAWLTEDDLAGEEWPRLIERMIRSILEPAP